MEKREVLRLQRLSRPDPFPVLYAQLDLGSGRDHSISWQVQQPFRATELLLFGGTDETWLKSFKVGFVEQIVQSFPFLKLMHGPGLTVAELLELLQQPPPAGERRIEGARLKAPMPRVNGMTLQTASPGVYCTLRVSGPLSDVAMYGVSVD